MAIITEPPKSITLLFLSTPLAFLLTDIAPYSASALGSPTLKTSLSIALPVGSLLESSFSDFIKAAPTTSPVSIPSVRIIT